jgi:sterol desaturase/sphingolipid hydroxylase (fatty acid hydroxylase superfamily)
LHHSQDYEATRSNYAGTFIFIDRMFGTCIDGEAELLGMEGGRRMSIREQMTYPFAEGWKAIRGRLDPSGNWPALGGGARMMGNASNA